MTEKQALQPYCFAVGYYGTTGSSLVQRNQVLHWNGRTWSRQHTPDPGGTATTHENELLAVGCGGPPPEGTSARGERVPIVVTILPSSPQLAP